MVLRHLRVRPGDLLRKEMDAITVYKSADVVIDHCSTSWGTDETLSVTLSRDVTVQWCMITESLNDSYHHKGPHGKEENRSVLSCREPISVTLNSHQGTSVPLLLYSTNHLGHTAIERKRFNLCECALSVW